MRRFIRVLTWWAVIVPVSSAKCIADFVLALLLVVLFLPIFVLYFLSARTVAFAHTERVGRWGVQFNELSFPKPKGAISRLLSRTWFRRLPVMFNILSGDISFVGPRLVSPGELSPRERTARKRYNVRPGLLCLWWVRKRANIAYSSELDDDAEYVETSSVWGDFGIAFRAIPAMLYGEGVPTAPDHVTILGITINNVTMAEAIDEMVRRLDGDMGFQICFVNADCANMAYRDAGYREVLRNAPYVLADGIGLKLAGKMLRSDIKQNVNGTDLFPRLCSALEGTGKRVFLLGARPGITDAVRDWVAEHAPGAVVCGVHHGYYSAEEEPDVIRRISEAGADLLLVAFGAPRQDEWIAQHIGDTGAKVAMGVGGLFDFYSGRVARAPQWMREIGMEWLYRFIQEPGRMWKRYFVGNFVFLLHVVLQKLGRSAPT